MRVFDDLERSDATPAANQESHAEFLNRVHTPYWDEVRTLIEDWLSRMPTDAQADVRARLRSKDNRQFYSAFWELYLHETLVRAGYEVTCHPALTGTSRRPDFLAKKNGEQFVLEARTVPGSDDEIAAERRRGRIYDALNRLDTPNFFLWIDVYGEGDAPPRTAPLRNQLQRWLGGLDPDEVAAAMEGTTSYEAMPVFEWKSGDWHLLFRAMPKSTAIRGQAGIRPIGAFGPGEAGIVDDVSPLRRALHDKGGAYGDLGIPYIIAILAMSLMSDETDMVDALYGSSQVRYSRGTGRGLSAAEMVRAPDGFWYGARGWEHTNVSAVLTSHNLLPWNVATEVLTLWRHPDARHPVNSAPMWRQADLIAGRLEHVEPRITANGLLGLPTPWPPGAPFEPYPSATNGESGDAAT